MNISPSESVLGRQRCRQWIPLLSQQCRLRHVFQIFGINFSSEASSSYYFTLHLTTMSAPFYTSEEAEGPNPKWLELDVRNIPNSSTSAMVLRVWQGVPGGMDAVIVTWGINFSGFVYLGNKLCDIEPTFFEKNSVIFSMRGGHFTIYQTIKQDLQKPLFLDNLNVIYNNNNKNVFRRTGVQVSRSEVRIGYNLEKLRKLQALQLSIKNRTMDAQSIRDKITMKCNLNNGDNDNAPTSSVTSNPTTNVRYAPQLLTMNSLNKMLQEKPTKLQRQEMTKINKEIERAKFISKLLHQEKDSKSALIRQLKRKLVNLIDKNEERNNELLHNYHQFSKEIEKLKDFKKTISQHRQVLVNTHLQLHHRRKQLLQELLFIYPIERLSEVKCTIHNVYLPNSDILADCSDNGLSVALGYISHILTMCSTFLQVPLRYPVTHCGSRSYITDHISPVLPDKERDFPLYTKGKEKMQFTYAVYLLNKNIAQLRCMYLMHTPELKATLPNLLALLLGKEMRPNLPLPGNMETRTYNADINVTVSTEHPFHLNTLSTNSNVIDPILDCIRQDSYSERGTVSGRASVYKTNIKSNDCGPGLSEILAIPEAFLNKQISSESFKNYVIAEKNRNTNINIYTNGKSQNKISGIAVLNENQRDDNCDKIDDVSKFDINIEQGMDLLDPSLSLPCLETAPVQIQRNDSIKQNKRISRSLDSYSDEDNTLTVCAGADQLFSNESSVEGGESQLEYLQEWLKNGTSFGSSDNICRSNLSHESPLTVRTKALLTTKTFNLVKPKY